MKFLLILRNLGFINQWLIFKILTQNICFFIFQSLCTVRFVSETASAKGFPDANAVSAKQCLDLFGFHKACFVRPGLGAACSSVLKKLAFLNNRETAECHHRKFSFMNVNDAREIHFYLRWVEALRNGGASLDSEPWANQVFGPRFSRKLFINTFTSISLGKDATANFPTRDQKRSA